MIPNLGTLFATPWGDPLWRAIGRVPKLAGANPGMDRDQDRSADCDDDAIVFLDDASVVVVEDPAIELDEIVTRVWIRPYAGR